MNVTRIDVEELHQHTRRYLTMAGNGVSIEVTEHGRPVAQLVPAPQTGTVLDDLVAAGRITPATTNQAALPPPGDAQDGINVADELAAMRQQERD